MAQVITEDNTEIRKELEISASDHDQNDVKAVDVIDTATGPMGGRPDGKNDLEEGLQQAVEESLPQWSIFGRWEKKYIVGLASLGAFFSPFTTNIYFPAMLDISKDLQVSVSKVNLSITTYMIFQGLAPSFIGSYSDVTGRRPVYVISFAIYVVSNIGLALNNSYVGLLVLRCLQSCGSSGMTTLKTAIICDVVTSAERGSYIAFTSLGGILGPTISPVIGGVLSEYKGWHWIFWFLLIISGAFFMPLLMFFPETCRHIVGDGSVAPPKWNKSLLNIYHEHKQKQKQAGISPTSRIRINVKQKRQYPNPLGTIRLICEKETALILLYGSLMYAGMFAVSTTITTQFGTLYHLSPTEQGLMFLPIAIGSICAAITNGKLLNLNYRRHAKRAGVTISKSQQHNLIGFPIERARLEIGIPFFCVAGAAGIVYGWMLQYRVHIAGPIVMLFIQGYCGLGGYSTMSVLIEDIHRTRAATASAAFNLTRSLLGAGSTAVVNPLIEAVGQGWCFTIVTLVMWAGLPILLVIIKKGPDWRQARFDRDQAKEAEKERKEGEDTRHIQDKVAITVS